MGGINEGKGLKEGKGQYRRMACRHAVGFLGQENRERVEVGKMRRVVRG